MKLNFTHIMVVRAVLFVLILLYSLVVFGQSETGIRNLNTASKAGYNIVVVKR